MVEAIIKRVLDTVRSNRNVEIISVKNDYSARFIEAVIAVDGKPIRIEPSCAVTIEAKRKDGFSKAFMGSVNADGTVKVPITQWMLEIPNTSVEASINVSTTVPSKLSTCNFFINVQDTPHKGDEISPDDPDYDVLAQVLAGEAERVAAEALRESKEAERVAAEQIRQEKEAERTDQKHLFSNALKKKKSGGIVAMSDISPLKHALDVRVRGKNLIPYPYVNTSKTQNGITFTDNGDGSITINGTSTAEAYFSLASIDTIKTSKLAAGSYTISGYNSNIIINATKNGSWWFQNGTGVFNEGDTFTGMAIVVPKGKTFDNVTIHPQLEPGTVATAHAPYIPDISAVKVKKLGKNLTAVNEVQLTGAETYKAVFESEIPTTFTLSWRQDFNKTKNGALFIVTSVGGDTQYISVGEKAGKHSAKITIGSNGAVVRIVNYCSETGRIYDIQTEPGEAASEFEPYIEPVEYAVNADGTVEGVLPIYPTTTLMTDTAGAVIDVEYNRDINKAFAELYNAIISLGGNV